VHGRSPGLGSVHRPCGSAARPVRSPIVRTEGDAAPRSRRVGKRGSRLRDGVTPCSQIGGPARIRCAASDTPPAFMAPELWRLRRTHKGSAACPKYRRRTPGALLMMLPLTGRRLITAMDKATSVKANPPGAVPALSIHPTRMWYSFLSRSVWRQDGPLLLRRPTSRLEPRLSIEAEPTPSAVCASVSRGRGAAGRDETLPSDR
jgi:hypothetical protein